MPADPPGAARQTHATPPLRSQHATPRTHAACSRAAPRPSAWVLGPLPSPRRLLFPPAAKKGILIASSRKTARRRSTQHRRKSNPRSMTPIKNVRERERTDLEAHNTLHVRPSFHHVRVQLLHLPLQLLDLLLDLLNALRRVAFAFLVCVRQRLCRLLLRVANRLGPLDRLRPAYICTGENIFS